MSQSLSAGIPPRNLQEFLAAYKWDEDAARDRLQELVMRDHIGPNSIGVIDETSDVKKGDKTPGVKRQWCGTVGKTENCIVTVIDGDLYLPEDLSRTYSRGVKRCEKAIARSAVFIGV